MECRSGVVRTRMNAAHRLESEHFDVSFYAECVHYHSYLKSVKCFAAVERGAVLENWARHMYREIRVLMAIAHQKG